MAQYIKINSQVFNADTFIAVLDTALVENAAALDIITTSTFFAPYQEETMNYWNIVTGNETEKFALVRAINSALTANPGGRVLEVPPSSDYTISSIVYVKGS